MGDRKKCIEMVEYMRPYYDYIGRHWGELEHNLNIARGDVSKLDRSLDKILSEMVQERQSAYNRANEENKIRYKVLYFEANGIWNMWCAAQHAALGSEMSTLQCCGFAIGHFTVARCLLNGEEEYMGLTEVEESKEVYMRLVEAIGLGEAEEKRRELIEKFG